MNLSMAWHSPSMASWSPAALAAEQVDVEYMYSLFAGKDGRAYMVLRISDEAAFANAVKEGSITVVGNEELGLK